MQQPRQSPGFFMTAFKMLLALACYTPLIWLVTFYSYVWRATIKLGHIPRYSGYGTDDVTISPFHEDLISLAFTCVFFSPFIVFVLALVTQKTGKSRFRTINIIIYAATFLLAFLLLLHDGFFEWYVD